MKTILELRQKRDRLKAVLQTLDENASFETECGRTYAQWLAKVVMVELQIEESEKKKAAQ
ncbi:hypothetical protein PAE9249_03884 [Paenibacillus sp. CECT 9249]|uniref:hypothetical protein n=1 Tax=Paenibacillus sp. CECT 9249 TaxID=2845385 RepID=UPI001E5455F5|nr:hypothetical protein [Paenibacillus sp. CECT 9249]CAH0121357.1 hypothetical protein PAE9249_03884 [Paenibacillus sp. CECT 9249]